MTILLYNFYELEERASRHLNAWKAWHLTIYAFAGIFGILNYVFLQNTMMLVDNNCVLFPRELAFRSVDLSEAYPETNRSSNTPIDKTNAQNPLNVSESAQNSVQGANNTNSDNNNNTTNNENEGNPTYGNESQIQVLDTSRTLFAYDSDCQFAEYMPIMSMIFAAVWATMFTMCPGGGYSRSGLQQPWRILTPALLFALVMVILTGYSFTSTNQGLHAFCAAFYNVTNSTTCSSVGAHLEQSWGRAWDFGGRAAATRAGSAGAWAAWACAAALLLARCLAAPDFQLRRTGAYLKDPDKKITPLLKKNASRLKSTNSPTRFDNNSVRSEPTVTTELVTASIEQDQITAPPSLQATPVKLNNIENIEMYTTPNIRP